MAWPRAYMSPKHPAGNGHNQQNPWKYF